MEHTKRVFLVHGWDGNPENHWFPWLKRELGRYGFTVFALAMPNAAHPKVDEWIEALQKAVVLPDRDTYFVAHSLGCIAVARYLSTLFDGTRVGGCVFVGGFSGDSKEPEIAEFSTLPFDVTGAKRHCHSFVSILSDNDTSVPLALGRSFHEQLGGSLIVEHKKGHFTARDGVLELPSVLDAVLELSGEKIAAATVREEM